MDTEIETSSPSVRLAVGSPANNIRNNSAFSAPESEPSVRLAICATEGEGGSMGGRNMEQAFSKKAVKGKIKK